MAASGEKSAVMISSARLLVREIVIERYGRWSEVFGRTGRLCDSPKRSWFVTVVGKASPSPGSVEIETGRIAFVEGTKVEVLGGCGGVDGGSSISVGPSLLRLLLLASADPANVLIRASNPSSP